MKEERAMILDMVARGKITPDEGERLLAAVEGEPPPQEVVNNGSAEFKQKMAKNPAQLPDEGKKRAKLTADHLLRMSREGVDPEFIRAVKRLNIKNLTGDHIVRMGIEGVDPQFIQAVSELNTDVLTGDHIVSMGIEGVDIDFIEALNEFLASPATTLCNWLLRK